MQRYFIDCSQIDGEMVRMTGDDVHHMTRVMRMQLGTEVVLCDSNSTSYLAKITKIEKDEVMLCISSPLNEKREMPVAVTIAQGITKSDKFETVLQKGTECGVSGFRAVKMKRSVAKIDAKKETVKLTRWRKIVKEAAEQSHRQKVPVVGEVCDFVSLLKDAHDYDVCLFAYEEVTGGDSMKRLPTVLSEIEDGAKVLVLIGPEGGIDASEATMLQEAGFLPISLGPRILRTETAPIYVLSAISYALELKG